MAADFVAGPPDMVDEKEVFSQPDDAGIRAKVTEQTAAANGRLYLATNNGKVLCFGEKE